MVFQSCNHKEASQIDSNVRGSQGKSGNLESPIKVIETNLFLSYFLEFQISLCSGIFAKPLTDIGW